MLTRNMKRAIAAGIAVGERNRRAAGRDRWEPSDYDAAMAEAGRVLGAADKDADKEETKEATR